MGTGSQRAQQSCFSKGKLHRLNYALARRLKKTSPFPFLRLELNRSCANLFSKAKVVWAEAPRAHGYREKG